MTIIATKKGKETRKKICSVCKKEKSIATGFYKSSSPLFALDGCVPICIECVKNDVTNEDGTVNENKLKTMCQRLDKPFYTDELDSAFLQTKSEHGYLSDDEVAKYGKQIVGFYFKNINTLRQNKDKSFVDSENDGFVHKTYNINAKQKKERLTNRYTDIIENKSTISSESHSIKTKNEEIISSDEDVFEASQDMIDMFGEGYSRIEYKNMYKKYNDMQKNYTIQTNIHKEALLTYVRFKVKEELATAKGNVQEAQKWYQAAQDAADKAKLTPKQLSKADLQGGITNFSDIFKAVEEANERIPIFPEFRYRPNDAVDFILWCYINYERNLNSMPEVKYSDVYKFYDEKKQEYMDMYGDPYGIFANDPTLENRDTVEKFITVPIEFREGDN